jgi:hypothetical protein
MKKILWNLDELYLKNWNLYRWFISKFQIGAMKMWKLVHVTQLHFTKKNTKLSNEFIMQVLSSPATLHSIDHCCSATRLQWKIVKYTQKKLTNSRWVLKWDKFFLIFKSRKKIQNRFKLHYEIIFLCIEFNVCWLQNLKTFWVIEKTK